MLGFGGLVRHNTPNIERPKTIQPGSLPMQNISCQPVPSQTDEDQFNGSASRAGFTENKVLPSEINAESLRIVSQGSQGSFLVDSNSALISKIYFQKKQFIWEYTDNSSSDDKQRKRRIEVKFGDVTSISVQAKEGQAGNIIICTNKQISLYKEKQNAPGKNTQWDKTDNFTGGFERPKDAGILRIETHFAKDALNKPSNKITHLSKLLSCDTKLKQMIESNSESCFDKVREVAEGSEGESVKSEMKTVEKGLSLTELGINQDMISKDYADDMMSKPVEELVEMVTKELKPRNYPQNLKKKGFLCPACKPNKYTSDTSLREHMQKKHKNLVDLGLEVLQNGHFRASPYFLVNVLALVKAKPQLLRQIMKNSISFEYDS